MQGCEKRHEQLSTSLQARHFVTMQVRRRCKMKTDSGGASSTAPDGANACKLHQGVPCGTILPARLAGSCPYWPPTDSRALDRILGWPRGPWMPSWLARWAFPHILGQYLFGKGHDEVFERLQTMLEGYIIILYAIPGPASHQGWDVRPGLCFATFNR